MGTADAEGGGGGGGAKLDIEEYEVTTEGLVFVDRVASAGLVFDTVVADDVFLVDLLELPPVDFPDCFELADDVLGVLPVDFIVPLLAAGAVDLP